MAGNEFTTLQSTEDVTEPVLRLCEMVYDAWFAQEPNIDWEAFWDRLEGYTLPDGSRPDVPDLSAPAVRRIKRHIAEYRREG